MDSKEGLPSVSKLIAYTGTVPELDGTLSRPLTPSAAAAAKAPKALPAPTTQQLPRLHDTVLTNFLTKPKPREIVARGTVTADGETQKDTRPVTYKGRPIKRYRFGDVYYNMVQPENETNWQVVRQTQTRTLTYRLNVAQQPHKARACGSGTKSSNDRRPVDPPPVVILSIYDENGLDVTTSYDATFMLYASLENRDTSRPIAHSKMHLPQNPPVLAGVTVASAAYLECRIEGRPVKAAYFIFPDLSVRHEGHYRLRFSLFEGLKNEQDFDLNLKAESSSPAVIASSSPVRTDCVFNRMDVVSMPFQVWSAKRFPGLDQSTDLSIAISEQGCRVRIRRDIRQRKRARKVMDGDDACSSYQGTPQVPQHNPEHARSASRNSLASQYDRRESTDSMYGQRPMLPGRQLSTSMASLASPLPMTPTSAMPPPAPFHQHHLQRPSFDSTFPRLPAPPYLGQMSQPPTPTTPQSMFPPAFGGPRPALPPFSTQPNAYKPEEYRPMNILPAPISTKRPLVTNDYYDRGALKQGARPDTRPAYSYEAPVTDTIGHIVPDDGENSENDGLDDDSLLYQPMAFKMSNGGRRYMDRFANPRFNVR